MVIETFLFLIRKMHQPLIENQTASPSQTGRNQPAQSRKRPVSPEKSYQVISIFDKKNSIWTKKVIF